MSGSRRSSSTRSGSCSANAARPDAAVGGLAHRVALVLEGHAQRQPDGVVVFDEQQGMHFGNLLAVVNLLQKTHTRRVVPSHSVRQHSDCSRCPGGVPTSPWYSTGSAKAFERNKCGQHTFSSLIDPSLIHLQGESLRRRPQVLTPTLTAHTDTYPSCHDDQRGRAHHQPRASDVDPQHVPHRAASLRLGHQPVGRVAARRSRCSRRCATSLASVPIAANNSSSSAPN